MIETNFQNSNLVEANFISANLTNANFEGANLNGATWIDNRTCKAGSIGECK